MSLAIALEAAAQHLRQLKQQRKALDEFLALENESGRAYALDKEIGSIQDAISSCAKEAGVWVEYLGETCMDGGTCHHECADRCFRRECCVPLTQAVDAGLTMEQWRYPEAVPQAVQAAVPEAIEQMAVDRYKVVPSHESMFHRWAVVAGNGTQQLYIGREVECQNMARKFMGAFLDGAFVAMQNTAPAHPAEGVPAQAVAVADARSARQITDAIVENFKDAGWYVPSVDEALVLEAVSAAIVEHGASEPLTGVASDVDSMARVLMAAFAKAEPEHPITRYPTSFVATFADMARAALATTQPAAQGMDALDVEAVILEHSGCGHNTQVDQLTVRLNPGDKVVLRKGRITQGYEKANAALAAQAKQGEVR